MDKTLTSVAVLLAVAVLGIAVFFGGPLIYAPQSAPAGGSGAGTVTVSFFYGEECPHCHTVMPFIESLRQKYPDVDFQVLETWHNETNKEQYTLLNSRLGQQNYGVPEVIVGDVVLIGDKDIPAKLESVILDQKKKK
jgi:thiol-disulfide isomerase/thioredoxin